MHVAAANPQALDRDSVDADLIERERTVLIQQAQEEGKPAEIAEKMVTGRINKYYKEICLLEQIFVIDGESTVKAVIEAAAKEAGADIKLTAYTTLPAG